MRDCGRPVKLRRAARSLRAGTTVGVLILAVAAAACGGGSPAPLPLGKDLPSGRHSPGTFLPRTQGWGKAFFGQLWFAEIPKGTPPVHLLKAELLRVPHNMVVDAIGGIRTSEYKSGFGMSNLVTDPRLPSFMYPVSAI